MTGEQLQKFKAWFADYIGTFYSNDTYINANLELKKIHTEYVCTEAVYVAEAIGLGANGLLIAETTGLFHDVGRFEQFTKYKTYSDAKSESHSLMAVRILKDSNVLAELNAAEQNVILKAVELHGIKHLPEGLGEQEELHAKILRDADKLDIYRVLIEKYIRYKDDPENFPLELEHADDPTYSSHLVEAIARGGQVDYTDLRTLNDMKLLLLAMIFDVNFVPTLKRIRQAGYVDLMLQLLPDNEDMEKVARTVLEYIDKKITETPHKKSS